jgi:signal transduction histidine kinase
MRSFTKNARFLSRKIGRVAPIFFALVLSLSLFALWIFNGQAATTGEQHVVTINTAKLIDLSNPSAPLQLGLPTQQIRSPRTFKHFRLEADFALPKTQVSPRWSLYFLSMYDGGRVSINGVAIGDVPTSTAQMTVRHVRPYMFHIPLHLLRNGSNQLTVEWSSSETLTLVSRIFVGPSEVVRPKYEHRLFWQNTMAQAAFVYALVIAVILLGIYSMRKHHRNYLLMGLGAIGWAIVCLGYFLPSIPTLLFPYWRVIHLGAIATLTSCSWIFLIRESRPDNLWFPKLCKMWAMLGPSVYLANVLITGMSFFRAFEGFWLVTSLALGLYPMYCLARTLLTKWLWRRAIFLLATAAGVSLGIADAVLLSTGNSVFGGMGYTVQAVSVVWFTSLAAVLVVDFVNSIAAQDGQKKQLSLKLTEQENQLSVLHHAIQLHEREQATLQERQRIMQDIHDGLGSQLITSLAMSERGALSREQTNLLLRECIDDLRLAIDTMSDTDDQFGMVAGNLRFRMESRLRSAGITLKWDSSGFSDSAVVPASKTLPLLRIMQESITNALKHAQATEIRVVLSSDEQGLHIQISDNGKGFDVAKVRLGKGIGGMEKRARGITAVLSITSSGIGTVIQLHLPHMTRSTAPNNRPFPA